MKLLGLLRHAKSDWDDMSLRDFDRGLNGRGRKGAALMGKHIREHGAKWERIIASPAARVKMTLAASKLDARENAGTTEAIDWQDRAYLASSATLMELLKAAPKDTKTILLAGHNPGLQELIFELVAPDAENDLFNIVANKYPTATFAVIKLDIDNWSEITPDCGRLVHLARPRDLDPELGPEKLG